MYNLNNLLAFLFVFIHAFPFQWDFLPFSNTVILFFLSSSYVIFRAFSKVSFTVARSFACFSLLVMLVFLVSALSNFINFSTDFSQLKIILIFFVVYSVNSYFIISLFMKDWGLERLINCFICVLLAQFFLAVLISFFEPFRDFYLNSVSAGNAEALERSAGVNVRLMGFGIAYFNLGTIFSFGLVFIAYYLRAYKVGLNKLIFLSVSFVLIAIGALFSARSGVVGVLVAFVMLFSSLKAQTFRFFISLFVAALVCLFVFLIVSPVEKVDFIVEHSVPWAFEMFLNAYTESSVSTASTDQLKSMYFFPDSLQSALIGDARLFVEGGYYMGTDAGYVRQIFSYGLIGLVFSLVLYFYMFYVISRRVGLVLSGSLFLMVLVYNFKGSFIFFSSFDPVFVLIFIFIVLRHGYNSRCGEGFSNIGV